MYSNFIVDNMSILNYRCRIKNLMHSAHKNTFTKENMILMIEDTVIILQMTS